MQTHPKRPQFFSRSESSNPHITSAIGMEETVGHLRTRRNSLFARTVLLITGLICAALLLGTLAQAWSNSQLRQEVKVASQSLQQTQDENQNLKKQTDHYKDPTVIESEARQQLGYVRPSEQAVVITSGDVSQPTQAPPIQDVTPPHPYWQDWWNLFFG